MLYGRSSYRWLFPVTDVLSRSTMWSVFYPVSCGISSAAADASATTSLQFPDGTGIEGRSLTSVKNNAAEESCGARGWTTDDRRLLEQSELAVEGSVDGIVVVIQNIDYKYIALFSSARRR